MARKRSTPKPADPIPASIPFPDELAQDLLGLLGDAASLVGSTRLRRLILIGADIETDPDVLDDVEFQNTLRLDDPEISHDFDAETRRLRVTCTCRLSAIPGVRPAGARGKAGRKASERPLVSIEATFLLDYEVDAKAEFDDKQLEAFCDGAAATHAWPYWREFVRDASTRIGLPPMDVPFDVLF